MAIYTVYQKKILNENNILLEDDIVFIKDQVSILAFFHQYYGVYVIKTYF